MSTCPGGGSIPREQQSLSDRRVVFVVVAYESDRWLPDCLRSLSQEWNPCDALVLVDNSRNTEIATCARLIPRTIVVATPKPYGFAEANNFALLRGGLAGKYACLLNQDTLSEPGWVGNCVDELERHPGLAAVSPVLKTYDGADWDPGFSGCIATSPKFSADAQRDALCGRYEASQITATAMIVRSAVLREVGPFDPVFGSYYEDYDLCRRIRSAGYWIGICGNATVRHYGGSSTTTKAASDRRTRQVLRNRAIHRIRESGASRKWAFFRFLSCVPRNLLRGIARTPSSQPVGVQLAAYCDLLRLAPRITSINRDQLGWDSYLAEIGWPTQPAVDAASVAYDSSDIPL